MGKHKTYGLYEKYFKRLLDFCLSLIALIILFPVLLLLTIFGAVAMGGNPFFVQERPGKDEVIFRLIKFRSMNNKKDRQGKLLPDEKRLTKYGKFIRATSLDELPELINILKGDMAIVGPRPLLVKYLPLYSAKQRHRHDVRPGLTGLAQVNGRNALSWEDKFQYDLEYVRRITWIGDMKIVLATVKKALLKREGISQQGEATIEEFHGNTEKVTVRS